MTLLRLEPSMDTKRKSGHALRVRDHKRNVVQDDQTAPFTTLLGGTKVGLLL